VRDEGSALRNE
jgi:hypothetical protein